MARKSEQPERAAITLAIDYETLAKTVVHCLDVRPGEHILLTGGLHQSEFLLKLAVNVASCGGFHTLNLVNDEYIRRTVTDLPDSFLDRPISPHDRYLATLYDAALSIDSFIDETLLDDVSASRLGLGLERRREVNDLITARKRRSIFMAWPTEARARGCGMTSDQFHRLFFEALSVDIPAMTRMGTAIKRTIAAGGNSRITSPRGTDLRFTLDPRRRVMVDTGCFDPTMVREGDTTKNLPCGEVYTTPVEDSVNGTAVFDLVFHDGHPIKDLTLVFREGKLIEATAREGFNHFESHYLTAKGDKERIGELGIGINPALRSPIGHTLLDEKIYGSIHLALGENRMYGGINNASIHWDLVMQKPTLEIEKKLILTDGVFHHLFSGFFQMDGV